MKAGKPWKTEVALWSSTAGPRGGYVTHKVEIRIDWDEVARYLAKRAVANKSGRAGMMSGKIVCKVTKEKR